MKDKLTFLDLVIPFCISYMVMMLLYRWLNPQIENSLFSVCLVCIVTFFIMYGLFSFIRDYYRLFKMVVVKYYQIFKELIR